MTDRHDDAVDVFLADLGAAPVPGHVAANAMRRIRDERPPRASRVPAWFAAAAVLATAALALAALGSIVAGPGPSPTPLPSVSPSVSAPSPTPSSSAGPTPSAIESPTPAESPNAPVLGMWDITLRSTEGADLQMALRVTDRSGTMAFATATTRLPVGSDTVAANGLVFGRGRSDRVVIGWIASICDERGVLDLAPDGRTFTLWLPQRVGCDLAGFGLAVEITFVRTMDPAAFSGTSRNDLVRVEDVMPTSVAFATRDHGWVGGTTGGDAIILETFNGGVTWRVGRLGSGQVSDLAVADDGPTWAGRVCVEAAPTCHPGLYRYDDSGMWGWADTAWPMRLSFDGDLGAALFLASDAPVDDLGLPIPELRLTDDGGETWSTVTSPCPVTQRLRDAARAGATTVVVLCEVEEPSGSTLVEPYRSADGGRTWTRLAGRPYGGIGMSLDMAADGTGWMWGDPSTLLQTSDGGATWKPSELAGPGWIPYGADAWGLGAGVVLVGDAERDQTLLILVTSDGAWTELYAWPGWRRCCG